MGVDSSTQGMKAVVIDADRGQIVASEAVNFGKEFGGKYDSPEGVIIHPDPLVKHSDPLMWLEALELLLERMKAKAAPLSEVAAISGCGQQHGSVYLKANFGELVSSPPKGICLRDAIAPALSRKSSPIWMDSSTSAQCRKLDGRIGAEKVRERTGSAPIERFTGPQIMKFHEAEAGSYAQTGCIHLVSSFICSVLAGKSAPIDYGDGAGMNMLNIRTLQWDKEICDAIAPSLLGKLPTPAPSTTIVGKISPYFGKFGFSPETKIVAFTGDNPASLVGTGAATGSVAVISLGTSDTFFAAMSKAHTDPDGCGHVFGNPAGGFMSLICFKNGSLARERLKDELGVDWDFFGRDAFMRAEPGGGSDNIMTPHFVPEITPPRLHPVVKTSGSKDFMEGKASKEIRIRAMVESQMLAMRLHSSWIGERFGTIRITGGGSRSPGICQTAADVFGAKVETISVPDSAALGGAMIAAAATGAASFEELSSKFAAASRTIGADKGRKAVYDRMLDLYRELEKEG